MDPNKLVTHGLSIGQVTVETLGLLPAALSHDIGSDSQRPFAIVIVGGLITDLLISSVLLPALYVWFARPTDMLPSVEDTVAE